MLLRIRGKYFCAGVLVHERAAPILGYMRTWDVWRIKAYAKRRGWTVELVP